MISTTTCFDPDFQPQGEAASGRRAAPRPRPSTTAVANYTGGPAPRARISFSYFYLYGVEHTADHLRFAPLRDLGTAIQTERPGNVANFTGRWCIDPGRHFAGRQPPRCCSCPGVATGNWASRPATGDFQRRPRRDPDDQPRRGRDGGGVGPDPDAQRRWHRDPHGGSGTSARPAMAWRLWPRHPRHLRVTVELGRRHRDADGAASRNLTGAVTTSPACVGCTSTAISSRSRWSAPASRAAPATSTPGMSSP